MRRGWVRGRHYGPLLGLLLGQLICWCGPWLPATARGGDSDDSLDAAFAAAKQDPDEVVPLILEASRQISETPSAASHAIAERLRPFLMRAFFSPEVLPGMKRLGIARYRVKKGDVPSRIVKRYRVGTGILPYLNAHYDDRRIQIDSRLKVIDLADRSLRLVVDRKRFRIALWRSVPSPTAEGARQRVLMGYFPIACGSKSTPTPAGATRIAVKSRNPSWRNPTTGKVYGPHDKKNVLGGYWLGLSSKGIGKKGIGIHGYTGSVPKNWIGKPVSHGCIRMLQPDIDRVFQLAGTGTPVRIH